MEIMKRVRACWRNGKEYSGDHKASESMLEELEGIQWRHNDASETVGKRLQDIDQTNNDIITIIRKP